MVYSFRRIALIVCLLAVAVSCAFVGGLGNPLDVALIRDGIAARSASPLPTEAGLFLNYAGGAPVIVGLGVIVSIILWLRGQVRRAIAVVAIVFVGRMLVEGIKIAVHRARPALDPHPVITHSLSFPSAHAANSMIVFPLMALLFAPAARRTPWVVAGIAASLIIGASRSLIGVHWPSDVVAGWSFGAAWLLATWPLAQWLAPIKPQHDVVGRHHPAVGEI